MPCGHKTIWIEWKSCPRVILTGRAERCHLTPRTVHLYLFSCLIVYRYIEPAIVLLRPMLFSSNFISTDDWIEFNYIYDDRAEKKTKQITITIKNSHTQGQQKTEAASSIELYSINKYYQRIRVWRKTLSNAYFEIIRESTTHSYKQRI